MTDSNILAIMETNGSPVVYHRNQSLIPCPCRTPQGFRDPRWHVENPAQPVCDANAMLPDPGQDANFTVKGFVQPVASTRGIRLAEEIGVFPVGEIQTDDHIGLLPTEYAGNVLEFSDWGAATEDYLVYNGRKYTVVNANLMPDALTGHVRGHWELALRLIA
jgi:hypothetical protein